MKDKPLVILSTSTEQNLGKTYIAYTINLGTGKELQYPRTCLRTVYSHNVHPATQPLTDVASTATFNYKFST